MNKEGKAMKVYIVWCEGWDGSEIESIHATREGAEAFMKKEQEKFPGGNYDITEWEVEP